MEFSNLFFLYILFPAVILIYFLMPDMRKKNLALLVISLVIYAMGQPVYMGLMVFMVFASGVSLWYFAGIGGAAVMASPLLWKFLSENL